MQDKCVRCGAVSQYSTSTPTSIRFFYVEGAGQLCKECWQRIYGDSEDSQEPAVNESGKCTPPPEEK